MKKLTLTWFCAVWESEIWTEILACMCQSSSRVCRSSVGVIDVWELEEGGNWRMGAHEDRCSHRVSREVVMGKICGGEGQSKR